MVIAAILIAIATGIGTVLCYLPGLIVGFLTSYTLLFIVDQQMEAIDAIKASNKLVTAEPRAGTLIYCILAGLILLVGACLLRRRPAGGASRSRCSAAPTPTVDCRAAGRSLTLAVTT